MFQHDAQTSITHNSKRETNEHLTDQKLTTHFDHSAPMRYPRLNTRSNNYKSETNHILQRQRAINSFLNKPNEIEVSNHYEYIFILSTDFHIILCLVVCKNKSEKVDFCECQDLSFTYLYRDYACIFTNR